MGKTTTKEAAALAMGRHLRVLKTEGNLNNLYGLPLTLLELGEEDVAVLEMGMSEPGEIARLAEIAKPDVGVLTNVAEVHLEFFDSIAEIADAKGELLLGLAGDAVAVVNADDPLVLEQARKFAGRQIRFGLTPSSDLRARQIRSTSAGLRFRAEEGERSVEVTSSLHGRHNVYNLLAGLAAARALDVPLEEACLRIGVAIARAAIAARGFHFQVTFFSSTRPITRTPGRLSALSTLLSLMKRRMKRRMKRTRTLDAAWPWSATCSSSETKLRNCTVKSANTRPRSTSVSWWGWARSDVKSSTARAEPAWRMRGSRHVSTPPPRLHSSSGASSRATWCW